MTTQVETAREIFIGGRFEASDAKETFEAVDPATEQVLALLPECTESDLDRAVAAGAEAQRQWAALPWQRRSRVLAEFGDALAQTVTEFAELDVADSGNPIGAMRDDVTGGI